MDITENGFRDEYSFLSNFTVLETPIVHDGISYPTVEHFYQACKFSQRAIRCEVARHPSKGLKKYVRSLGPIREDWDNLRGKVMSMAIVHKFSRANPRLRQQLINTGDTKLVEYNWWGDKHWGVCRKTGEGKNTLGKLLMLCRNDIREEG